MSREKQKYSAEYKVRILREHLENQIPVGKLCEENNINPNSFYQWKKELFQGARTTVLHHEVRRNMAVSDVQLTIQKAREKYPFARPGIITDNGAQYISKEFNAFIKNIEATHIKTSVAYPQSNGKIERFHRTISEECLRTKSPITESDFREYIAAYVKHYNTGSTG